MKRIFLILGGCIALFIVVFSLKYYSKKGAIAVTTVKVEYRNIVETVSADGNIQPTIIVKMSPDVPGQITELPVHEGQRVTKGELLAKIFPDTYMSAFKQAEASYNSSKASVSNAEAQLGNNEAQYNNQNASYQRNKKLFDQGAISQSDFEAAKASFLSAEANRKAAQDNIDAANFNAKSAEATMNEARDNLTKTSVLAPIDGVVVGLAVKEGERVVGTAQMAGTEMMSIADLSNMEADVNVNENDIVNVTKGDTALVEVDAFTNRKFKGIISDVSNSANVSSNNGSSLDQVTNFTVKIHLLPSSYSDLIPKGTHDSPFKPGMSATADIQVKTGNQLLSLPIEAVTTRKNTRDTIKTPQKSKKTQVVNSDSTEECVFMFNNGKTSKVIVKTGIQDANYIEIKQGLNIGAEVISGPFNAVSQLLSDGSPVKKQ